MYRSAQGDIKMTIAEKIGMGVQQLPAAYQAEVLDFVEYLLMKATRGGQEQEECVWRDLAVTSAMRGMEDEDLPQYTKNDLKVIFS
jgi:hypothetical protein